MGKEGDEGYLGRRYPSGKERSSSNEEGGAERERKECGLIYASTPLMNLKPADRQKESKRRRKRMD